MPPSPLFVADPKKNQRGLKPEGFRKPSVLKPKNGCVRPHLDSASKWATLSNSPAGACVLESDQVPISVLPFADCVTKGRLLNLSEPPFPDLYDESNNKDRAYLYLLSLIFYISKLEYSSVSTVLYMLSHLHTLVQAILSARNSPGELKYRLPVSVNKGCYSHQESPCQPDDER